MALHADFSFAPGTGVTNTPVSFTDLSQGGPTSWAWTFERAIGSGTSALPSPPQQTWGFAGSYTVTLEVRRGGERDTAVRQITIYDPPPGTPVVTDIVSTEGPPYDDQTDYTFFAHHVAEPVDRCYYTFEGSNVDCVPVPSHGTTMLQGTHRFPAGSHAIRLTVEGPGGITTRTLSIVVSSADTSAPSASVDQTGPLVGTMAFTATADDAESGVARIEMFGQINVRCYRIGDLSDPGVPFAFDHQSSPYATGERGELVPAGGTSVTFTAPVQVCGAGLEPGPPLAIDVWAVVTNGAGQAFTTDHYLLFT